MIYLASPYSHPDPAVRRGRAKFAAAAASILTRRHSDVMVYSPIAHGHAMHESRGLPESWEFWRPRSRAAVEQSTEIAFLLLDQWWSSVGMATEYQWAKELRIPTRSYILDARHRLLETAGPLGFSVEPRP